MDIENRDLEIVRLEFDLVFDEKTSLRQLSRNWEYGVVAFGDYRVEDIDIYVYKDVNGEWVLLQKDEDAASKAVVIVDPTFDGTYMVKIMVYKFREGFNAARYGLLVFHE